MHLLATSSASLDDLVEPIDLVQAPADILALSFTDSDLAAIGAAWNADSVNLPTMRLAALRDLRHPMSVDLWIDKVARHAKVILVRILGGHEWWRYGCDQLAAMARQTGAKLILLPGECRDRDERLVEASTVSPFELDRLLAYFREGGPANMRALVQRLSALAGNDTDAPEARPLERAGFYQPGIGVVDLHDVLSGCGERPIVPILFYRSMLLASDIAPIDALCAALGERGLAAAPVFVASLKDEAMVRFVEAATRQMSPAAIITATAFAVGTEGDTGSLFDRLGIPVFQVITATTRLDAWQMNQRGLGPADLAMHVVLPELDGRILAGAISFKRDADIDLALSIRAKINHPVGDRIAAVATRVAAMIRLQRTSKERRKILILMPHYPSAPGRTGYAVGLDVPNSVIEIIRDLKNAGYHVDNEDILAKDLLSELDKRAARYSLESYAKAASIPAAAMDMVNAAWGSPENDPDARAGCFEFRVAEFGHVTVALAPDRGRYDERRADYHDPALPPRHALIAFGCWMRETLDCHALVHVGAHGTLEWLPGKAVALSKDCFPEIVTGHLPVVYPFIVSNPGEAAQAKRRIGAVTVGHLPPPLTGAGLTVEQQALERLVDEYAQADGLDSRRRNRLARLIVDQATASGLALEAGVAEGDDPEQALVRIDSWLCDVKDFAIKDGLHVFGRAEIDADPVRAASASAERKALTDALDGRHVAPGPAGAPSRGRLDVLPTGRNLFAVDPRSMPTPTAFEIGSIAAEEVVRRFMQDHGDFPRSLVLDLWGSASLRTGGEEIAHGLWLMGCRPQWEAATGRVTGIEVLPLATLGRPRVDVTWRISGLFRDMFPTQIALMSAAALAVADRDEGDGENALADERRRSGKVPARIFGTSPGTYGTGTEDLLASGRWQTREEIGQAYLDSAAFSFDGADAEPVADAQGFTRRVAAAELLIHSGDDAGRDILEGSADVAFMGGFSAAVAALGGNADVVALDTTNPAKPRARSVVEAVTRAVRARAVNARFIAGQMRHGPRGASEFAETVDRLIGFAETTAAIPQALIETVYDAYVGDVAVRSFMLDQNPVAARFIAERFLSARRRGLWTPLRNSIDNDLESLMAEALAQELAA